MDTHPTGLVKIACNRQKSGLPWNPNSRTWVIPVQIQQQSKSSLSAANLKGMCIHLFETSSFAQVVYSLAVLRYLCLLQLMLREMGSLKFKIKGNCHSCVSSSLVVFICTDKKCMPRHGSLTEEKRSGQLFKEEEVMLFCRLRLCDI